MVKFLFSYCVGKPAVRIFESSSCASNDQTIAICEYILYGGGFCDVVANMAEFASKWTGDEEMFCVPRPQFFIRRTLLFRRLSNDLIEIKIICCPPSLCSSYYRTVWAKQSFWLLLYIHSK